MSNSREHPKTEELVAQQHAILDEGQKIKQDARSAISVMRDVLEALSKTEIDLASILLDSPRPKPWKR